MPKGLVLDGGGVFGIGQAWILRTIDINKFDFFVGTSIGSMIAAMAALDLDLSNLPLIFHNEMKNIFKLDVFRKYNPFTPKYSDKNLNRVLQECLDGYMLGDVNKPLFVTSAHLSTRRLKVFKSDRPDDKIWPIWEVVRCATAAETYFAPWKGYADGGVFANNPSMVAIASACEDLGYNIGDLEILSIGTGIGSSNCKIPKNFSLFNWGKWLLMAMLEGSSNSMHGYFANAMPIKKYKRIQFIRDDSWEMDNPKDMIKAEEKWKTEIEKAVDVVKKF